MADATPVPATLPRPTGHVRDLKNWYMTAALYARLDQARTRQYPQASTMEFALWLLETALNDYERAEQHARMTKAGLVTSDQARRLIDVPPPHQLIVR